MDSQARRMESLLKDLLWLSKIESTEHRIKDQRVDMTALLAELNDEVSSIYPDRPLQLQIDCQDSIIGEYRELYSAVSNLVLNAYKYSVPDGPVVVSWKNEARTIRLEVIDKGIGIDTSHFPRLTERFYRVDESRSSESGGTGLGLAIVKHVATAHGAHLEIESKPGQGSTFSLIFPAHE
jgi:two-component system phosphate regulon sensor histidine kinase PhoR